MLVPESSLPSASSLPAHASAIAPLRLAAIGCGARVRAYTTIARQWPDLYTVVGAADLLPQRVATIRTAAGNANFRSFGSADELLAADKFADVLIVGTQDAGHFDVCIRALKKGYDVLLEKPMATRPGDVLAIEACAQALGRRVLVCHVLRYSPFFRRIKEIVDSGVLGDIISLNAQEGVEPWHHAHSYVRGWWSNSEASSPLILAKSCHDLDIIVWLLQQNCQRVSSYGSLTWFRPQNAPDGAPLRCTDGCPVETTCLYNATRYATVHQRWLRLVMDGARTASQEQITQWLRQSRWGRCVYHCDNTALDHQVVAMEFSNGATATFTVTAFEEGRHIEIFGTRGSLRASSVSRDGAGLEISIRSHATGKIDRLRVPAPDSTTEGHGGADAGLIAALRYEMTEPGGVRVRASLAAGTHSHMIAFAAEHARKTGQAVALAEFIASVKDKTALR